ncbi:MAG: phospho-N-acetylmuramoyl-pentapeptide-transferase [Clostridia bacterium]|nr:phospho-N-acetylmuramoyl-pentapeptide-transferase [Clostridia bacterium]
MLYTVLPWKALMALTAVVPPVLCALLLRIFRNKLPRDHGREFAVNGMKSAGKIRGAGIIFVCAFIVCALLFVPIHAESLIYYGALFLEMLSGYLDDRSEKPWGEYKKGLVDLVISAAVAANFVICNPELFSVRCFGFSLRLPAVVFGILAALLVWMLINAVNCTDGIDGFSGSLTIVSLISVGVAILLRTHGMDDSLLMILLMILVLLPYLWKNAEPSTMMMGDAGSRALGLFLAVAVMKTGNFLLVIPLCLMLCLDGLLGIVKIVTIRFLHINPLKKIRTPLHDHVRKNIKTPWSNTQVIFRFCSLQIVISALTLLPMLQA